MENCLLQKGELNRPNNRYHIFKILSTCCKLVNLSGKEVKEEKKNRKNAKTVFPSNFLFCDIHLI